FGRTSTAKCAQCGQVSEAYSMIVIGASALPRTRSSGFTASASPPPGAGLGGVWPMAGEAPASDRTISRLNQISRMGRFLLLDVDANGFAPTTQCPRVSDPVARWRQSV